jgi:outer membrane immunogenic protein
MWRGVGGALVLAAATIGPAGAQVPPSSGSGFYLGAPDTTATPFGWTAMGRPGSRFDWAVEPTNDGGLQFGFNRRLGSWSFGLDSDWSWGHAEGCARRELLNLNSGCAAANWYGTAAGRIGYAWDRLHAYTKGGAAFSHWDSVGLFSTGVGSALDPDRSSRVALGWVLGGGLEYAMGGAWSLRAEYTYLDFGRDGSVNASSGASSGLLEQWDHERSHMLMFGLRRRM